MNKATPVGAQSKRQQAVPAGERLVWRLGLAGVTVYFT